MPKFPFVPNPVALRFLAALTFAVAISATPTPSRAGVISINFEGGQINPCCGGGGSADVTGTAGLQQVGNWNNFSSNRGSAQPLIDDDGSTTSATVTYSVGNNWAATAVAPGDGADADMMSGYLDNFGGQRITVSGLGASYTSGTYDVVVFFNSDGGGTQGFVIGGVTRYGRQVGGAGSNYPLGGPDGYVVSESTSSGSAPAANAVRFPGLNGSSFTITGAAGSGGNRARPNGIQIIGTDLPGLPAVTNNPATAVTGSSAQLHGTVSDVGTAAPTVKSFYGESDGGLVEGDWDASVSLGGTHTGAFSAGISGLDPATVYFYRAQATNVTGTAWASSAESFETDPEAPTVTNIAASDIGATLATVGANITATGGDTPVVTVHYGTADAGTGSWQQSVSLGGQSGSATNEITGLAHSTLYFFRASATNGGGTSWAPSSSSFTTGSVGGAAVVNDDPTGITGTTANLRGEVTDTGFDPPAVTVYYGTADAGTSTGAWQNSVPLGVHSGNFSAFVNGLTAETNYFFRASATNAAGTVWAPSTLSFNTTALVPDSVIINEIHYDPAGVDPEEFVELHNPSDSAIDMGGWVLEGGIDFTFPGGTSIPVGGYLVVAADPATVLANFGAASLGPFTGKLRNQGERIELHDALGATVDEVDYGVGAPWPTGPRGTGGSMELMHPSLDNDLSGSWRVSGADIAPPQVQTFLPAGSTGWRYRRGSSEASTPQSAWRELSFSEDGSWMSAPLGTPIGYSDGDDATVITLMEDVHWSLYFRHEFTVDALDIPSSLLVRAYIDDGCVVWINGVEITRFFYPGGATNFDTAANNHDAEWVEHVANNASTILNGGTNVIAVLGSNSTFSSSDFSFDVELKTPSGSSGSGTPTPGAANSVLTTNVPPQVRQVDHSPNEPASGQDVVISARITDPEGVASATVRYQIVEPGSFIRQGDAAYENPANWAAIAMHDDGLNGDLAAGDSTYSATIPASVQTHRRLIRYRIDSADNGANAVTLPYPDDEQPNFAYFVYDGIPSWTGASNPGATPNDRFPPDVLDDFATYHLIANGSDVNNSQYSGGSDGVHMQGALVYDGEVYDHMEFENRGEASTYQSGKNKWRFHFNRARDFEARDNWGKKYESPWDEMNFDSCASPWAPVHRGMAGVEEVVSYRLFQLIGSPSPRTHYVHFRIVDNASETGGTQYDGDLWGLYTAIEHPDGSFLDDRNLPDGNVYKIEGNSGDKKHQGKTQPTNSSDWTTFRGQSSSTQNPTWWRANMNMRSYYNFRGGNRITGNVDVREGANHYFFNDPVAGWTVMPWDLDMMFIAETHWSGTIHQKACLNNSELDREYRNRARELHDLLCTDESTDGGQMVQLVDEYAQMVNPTGQALTWADIDEYMWNYHPRTRGSPNNHSGQGNHKGNWFYTPFTDSRVGGSYSRELVSSDHEGSMNYLNEYVSDTFPGGNWAAGNGQEKGYGYEFLLSDAEDSGIPNKPTISYIGGGGFPSDDLEFNTSTFTDPQGNGSFAAMIWRVGEIANPSTPLYDPNETFKYEVEDIWDSGEISTFSSTYFIPPGAVRVGHTYRARVKYKDTTGNWSHWSDPVQFVASQPDLAPWINNLMITEIMYHPSPATISEINAGFSNSDFEFVELKNVGVATLDLTELRFTKGVDFDFAGSNVTSLAPGAYVIVARNVAAFESRHGAGLPVAGAYAPDSFSNGGENVKLSFGLGSPIHEFIYDDSSPWPEAADGSGASMVLIKPDSRPDHAVATNWRASSDTGNPNGSDAVSFSGDPNADNDSDDLVALLEHAFGSSDSDPENPSPTTATIGTGDAFTITFPRNLAAEDVDITFEKSTDLNTWIPDFTLIKESAIPQPDGTTLETWRLNTPISSAPRCFLRIRIELLP